MEIESQAKEILPQREIVAKRIWRCNCGKSPQSGQRQAAKKLATKAAEKLAKKGAAKIGEKTGQLVGEKIYDKFSTKPAEGPSAATEGRRGALRPAKRSIILQK